MSQHPPIAFCSACGSATVLTIPEGDHAPRQVCSGCGVVHYQNPKIIVGVVPEAADGRVLLCRRNIEPRLGFWTFPAGFMELGETPAAGAAREALEESEASIAISGLLSVISVPYVNQIHLSYYGTLSSPHFATTPESSEVGLFSEAEVPWDDIAFPTIYHSLKHFFACRAAGSYPPKTLDITQLPSRRGVQSLKEWLEAG